MDLLEVKSISKTYGSGETAVHALRMSASPSPKGNLLRLSESPALARLLS